MKKKGRPPKTNPESELARQDSDQMTRISPVGEQVRRKNLIRPEDITEADIVEIEAHMCARRGMWAQVAPERMIAAVVNVMGGRV